MFNNQALAAKRKVTAAENEAALKNAKRCYVMFANTIKGSIGTQSKELIQAVSIKDAKKRRSALDVVSSAIIDEAISRIEVSFAKYAAGKKKATASYGTTGMVQYDRNFMEQAVAASLSERKFSDLEPFRVDSMAAIAANGIYAAIVGKFFMALGKVRDKAGDFGYYYALGDLETITKMLVGAQGVFLDMMDSWGEGGGSKPAAGKPASNKKPAAGKPAATKPAAGGKPAANKKPSTGKSVKVL